MTNNSVYAYTNKYQRRLKKIIKQLNNKQFKKLNEAEKKLR